MVILALVRSLDFWVMIIRFVMIFGLPVINGKDVETHFVPMIDMRWWGGGRMALFYERNFFQQVGRWIFPILICTANEHAFFLNIGV